MGDIEFNDYLDDSFKTPVEKTDNIIVSSKNKEEDFSFDDEIDVFKEFSISNEIINDSDIDENECNLLDSDLI